MSRAILIIHFGILELFELVRFTCCLYDLAESNRYDTILPDERSAKNEGPFKSESS